MKLHAFIAGVFGIVGFGVSILAGLSSGNIVEAILLRSLVCAAVCYAVGYVVGLIAQQVALEHAAHVTKLVAEEDAKKQAIKDQEQADFEADSVVAVPATPVASASPVSGS